MKLERIRFRRVKKFFALGFGIEWGLQTCNDDVTEVWSTTHFKVFLGPFVMTGNLEGKKTKKVAE